MDWSEFFHKVGVNGMEINFRHTAHELNILKCARKPTRKNATYDATCKTLLQCMKTAAQHMGYNSISGFTVGFQ